MARLQNARDLLRFGIMSLNRFVYHSALIAGWAAFLVWLPTEALLLHRHPLGKTAEAAVTGALVGLAIAAALNFVSGMAGGRWRPRLSWGLLLGAVVAAAGGLLGELLYCGVVGFLRPLGWTARPLGWMVMGLGIGAAEGIYRRSATRIRNGLIGGGLGGLIGGALFDPIASAGSDVSSRATAFVILGLSIGALVGLAHVVLKEAWLTVVDGFGPGRQLILTESVTVLGRGDHLPLPFLGYAGRDLESEHVRITRHPDGQYVVEDIGSRVGTTLNGQQVSGAEAIDDGDLIKFGSNIVRFEQRKRVRQRAEVSAAPMPAAGASSIARPPPPPGRPEAVPPVGDAATPSAPGGTADSAHRSVKQGPQRDVAPRIPPPPPPPG